MRQVWTVSLDGGHWSPRGDTHSAYRIEPLGLGSLIQSASVFFKISIEIKARARAQVSSHTVDQKVKRGSLGLAPRTTPLHQDLGCFQAPPTPAFPQPLAQAPSHTLASPLAGGLAFPTPGCLIGPLSCRPFRSPAQNLPAFLPLVC